MKLPSPLKAVVFAFCALALFGAQLFGVERGFICLCSGKPVATASDHCHGIHGAHCHDNAEPAHRMESHLPDDDTVPHSQVAQDFRSTAASAAEAVLHPPTLRAVLMLDDSEGMRKSPICLVRFGAHERGSPRSCMGVVRGVVLLI